MINGHLEVRLRIIEMPQHVERMRNGWCEFTVSAGDIEYVLRIRPRAWKQISDAHKAYASWMAIMTGKLGARVKNGFRLTDISVQVVERGG